MSISITSQVTATSLLPTSSAEASSEVVCNKATTTLHNAADAAALAACQTYTGTIAVATDSEPIIEINGVEKLEGDFIAADNPGLTTLGGDGFVTITGTSELRNLPLLTNFTLPNWRSSGGLIMDSIPPPTVIKLRKNGQQISRMFIRNTTFPYIAGLTLDGSQMEVLEITGNPYLQEVNLGAGNITDHATIKGNGGAATVALPSLTYAYTLDIEGAHGVELPTLQSVSTDLDISGGDLQSLSLPQLSFVGGDLDISNNIHLAKLGMESLVNVQGDVSLVNNTELMNLNGLPSLSSVGGSLDLEGSFTSVDLQSLNFVDGDILIKSTGSLNCSEIPPSMGHQAYACDAHASTSDIGADDAHPDGSLSGGAIAGIVVGVVALLAVIGCLLAASAWLKLRRKRRAEMKEKDHGVAKIAPSEMSRRSTLPPYASEKDLPALPPRAEMGRPQSGDYPGPEGRYEMRTEPPAAFELPGHYDKCD